MQPTNRLSASQVMERSESIGWPEHRACGKEEWQPQQTVEHLIGSLRSGAESWKQGKPWEVLK